MLRVKHVSKSYGAREILKEVTFDIEANQTLVLMGRNGSGKSTLLKLLTGITNPNRGEIVWATHHGHNQIGYAPDRFPKLRLTASEYLLSMGTIQKIPEPLLQATIDNLLEQFHLTSAKHQRIEHYSKGMLQKINLIQALLGNPTLLLLDEPLSGLDPSSQQEFMMYLSWLKDQGMSMVIASHEIEMITAIADRMISLEEGRAIEIPVRYEVHEDNQMVITFEAKNENWRTRLHGYQLMYQQDHHVKILVKFKHTDLMLRQLLACHCQILEVRREEGPDVHSTDSLLDS